MFLWELFLLRRKKEWIDRCWSLNVFQSPVYWLGRLIISRRFRCSLPWDSKWSLVVLSWLFGPLVKSLQVRILALGSSGGSHCQRFAMLTWFWSWKKETSSSKAIMKSLWLRVVSMQTSTIVNLQKTKQKNKSQKAWRPSFSALY